MTKLLEVLVLLATLQDQPFNENDLTGWKLKGPAERSKWKVGKAALDPVDPLKLTVGEGKELVNAEGHSVDLYTEAKWGD